MKSPVSPKKVNKKAQQCSWRDMRRIEYILARKEKLRGEYNKLVNCGDAATVSHWRKIVEVKNRIGFKPNLAKIVTPEHLRRIGYGADEKDWFDWVVKSEGGNNGKGLTIIQLRSLLLAQESKKAAASTPSGKRQLRSWMPVTYQLWLDFQRPVLL